MALNYSKIPFSKISQHRECRVGYNLLSFIETIEYFKNAHYPSVKLGKLITLEYGDTLTQENRLGGEFPVVGSNGIVGYHNDFIIEAPSIVIGRKGSAGEVTYLEKSCYPIDTTFYVKTKNETYNLKFLYYVFLLLNLKKLALKKGVPGLNRYDAYEVYIPVVPKNDQEKILKKIERLEGKITDSKALLKAPLAIINEIFAEYYKYSPQLWKTFGKGMTAGTQKSDVRQLKSYKVNFSQIAKSKIQRVSCRFHNPITQQLTEILKNKPFIRINDIIREPIKRGVQPKGKPNGEITAIKTAQLKNGYFDFEGCDLVTLDFYENSNRGKVKFGDILISSTGKVSLGKVDKVDFQEPAIVDGHISIIRINENKYNGLFLTYFLRSLLGAFQIERDYTGATNQIELYTSEIKNFEIPDIPLSDQDRITQRIKTILDEQTQIRQTIEEQQTKISEIVESAIKGNAF